jgi:hypothetical protein
MGRSMNRYRVPITLGALLASGFLVSHLLGSLKALCDELHELRAQHAEAMVRQTETQRHADTPPAPLALAWKANAVTPNMATSGESCGSDLRAILDRSQILQNGPSMIYVHDGFLNSTEVAHMIRSGGASLGKMPYTKVTHAKFLPRLDVSWRRSPLPVAASAGRIHTCAAKKAAWVSWPSSETVP